LESTIGKRKPENKEPKIKSKKAVSFEMKEIEYYEKQNIICISE